MTEKSVAQCSVDGCLKIRYCKGECLTHYKRHQYHRRKANPAIEKCAVEGCNQVKQGKGWCNTHYSQYRRSGSPTKFLRKAQGVNNADKFWSRVDIRTDDECWEWQKSKTQGYGDVWIDGKIWKAHRYAWFLTHQRHTSLMILHSCDNPPCCNPKHLREGTNQDNMDDLVMRGRHPFRKAIDKRIYEQICTLLIAHSVATVCRMVDIKRSVLDKIKHGTHWTCKVYGNSN